MSETITTDFRDQVGKKKEIEVHLSELFPCAGVQLSVA